MTPTQVADPPPGAVQHRFSVGPPGVVWIARHEALPVQPVPVPGPVVHEPPSGRWQHSVMFPAAAPMKHVCALPQLVAAPPVQLPMSCCGCTSGCAGTLCR